MSEAGHKDEPSPMEQDPRPMVELPATGLPAMVIVIMAAVLAVGLFLMLDARRRAVAAPMLSNARAAPFGAFDPPPPLALPAELPPPALPVTTAAPATMPASPRAFAFMPPPPPLPPASDGPVLMSQPPPPPMFPGQQPRVAQGSLNEPALVLDTGPGDTTGTPAPDDTVRASLIRHRASVIPQGTLIEAVLETAIDSTRPGMVRAIIARDMSGFDGTRILIPRGSRLIGEYLSDIQTGQKRVLVNWTRLIRPDGMAIRIGSPGADPLGQAGVPGKTDTHFFARFAGAVLQSALAAGVNLASRAGDGSVIVGASPQVSGQLGQSLSPGADLRPTIKVRAGARISVFVAHDLDFSGTASVR